MRILVVEDDPNIAQLIETILHQHKYAVDLAIDGKMGLDLSDSYEYDAILLDVSLPKQDGISVCHQIRSRGNTVPILLLTALDSPADRTRGLDAGADDYLGKPFDSEELLARIRAILRRSHQLSLPILTWESLQLDPVSATVTYNEQSVPVTPKEYALLELFLRNSQRVFSCNSILDHLWSYDEAPGEEAIRTHIKGLRQKLKLAGAANDFIETVYGIGYRLKPWSPPAGTLLVETWEKFKDQIHEQVAVLERLAMRFLNQDLPADWQISGRNTAHSLSILLRTFGFSISSELAAQIEKLLSGHKDLTAEQGQWLFSTVVALQQELDRPVTAADIHYSDAVTDVLLVSTDADFNRAIQSIAIQRDWNVQCVPSILAARSLLQYHQTRSILLAPAVTEQTEEVLRLIIEVSKQVPPLPVILLNSATPLQPKMGRFGTYLSICPTNTDEIMLAIERAITTVEASQTHVLVVDDDLAVLATLQALLVPWGLKVTTLSDPQRFWEVLATAQPNLLILDVEMPTMNGLELCQSVRNHADWSQLPIIFLTSYLEPSLIQQVFATGADDFVTKPVVGPEIISRITSLMERQRLKTVERSGLGHFPINPTSKNKVRSMLKEIERSLHSLQYQLIPIQTKESHQLLQHTCDQVDRLHQLLLADT